MKIHMIGIGGSSMRGLAQYLERCGHQVTGCDEVPVTIDETEIFLGHDPAHIDGSYDRVIYSSAVSPSAPAWPELEAAKALGIESMRRAKAIGEITRERTTITVSGAHGKSTTTGLIAHVLIELGLDPLMMLGAPLPELGGQSDEWGNGSAFRWGDGPFVLEADEFDRSFYEFTPDIAVITNIEAEHLDYFTGGLPEIIETFATFLGGLKPNGTVIYSGDDANVVAAIDQLKAHRPDLTYRSYGRDAQSDYLIIAAELRAASNRFAVRETAGTQTIINLQIPGAHNQLNATAVFAVCRALGHEPQTIPTGLATFKGVGRRFDLLFEAEGEKFIFDYGHHPTELTVTLAAARAWYPDEHIRIIFQPHQYARTQLLFADFVAALGAADEVVVTDIYGVAGREEETTVSAASLAEAIHEQAHIGAEYVSLLALEDWIVAHPCPGVTLLMGAGRDIRVIAYELTTRHKATA